MGTDENPVGSTDAADACIVKAFKLLPEEAFESILKQLSLRPRSSRWKRWATPADVSVALKLGGEISSIARGFFKELSISSLEHMGPHGPQDDLLCVDVTTDEGPDVAEELITQLGPTLRRLHLDLLTFPTTMGMLNAPLPCPQLKVLKIQSNDRDLDLGRLMSSASGGLEELTLTGEYLHIGAVIALRTHCKGLRKLTLSYNDYNNSLFEVWPAVGPTLRELGLYFQNRKMSWSLISVIASSCRAIKTLSGMNYDFLKLAEALGPQLTAIRMFSLAEMRLLDLKKAADKNPDATLYLHKETELPETLCTYGRRMNGLMINELRLVDYDDDLCLGAEFGRLEELQLRCSKWIRDVIAVHPQPRLRRLSIIQCKDGPLDMMQFMDNVAFSCPNVEVVLMHMVRGIHRGVFRKFGELSQKLRKVELKMEVFMPGDFPTLEDRATFLAVTYVRDLFVCQTMRELHIENEHIPDPSAEIATACIRNKLRTRMADVFVNQTQYNR